MSEKYIKCEICQNITFQEKQLQKCKYCGVEYTKERGNKMEYNSEEYKKCKKNIHRNVPKQVNEEDVKTMLYCEGNEFLYCSVEEYVQECKLYDEYIVDRLWVTELIKLSFDACDILRNATEELHENAFDFCDLGELQKILDEYAAKQTGANSYMPRFDKYVLVNKKKERKMNKIQKEKIMSGQNRLTDLYGNLQYTFDEIKDKMVQTEKVKFFIKEIKENGLVVMDKTKPFKILDENYVMNNCIKQGNYAVIKELVSFAI